MRGLVTARQRIEKTNIERSLPSRFSQFSPIMDRDSGLHRQSMFVHSDRESSDTVDSHNIQDLFNETYFPTSYCDISDANILKSMSNLTNDTKAIEDMHHIKRLAFKESPREELYSMLETLKLQTVHSYFDPDEMNQ
jgi:hypothetical protein